MRTSIRRQMAVVFASVIVFLLLLVFVINSGFLEQYYIMRKQRDLLEVYQSLNETVESGTISSESIEEVMLQRMEQANLSVIVLRSDGTILFSTVREGDSPLYMKLLSYVFDKNQDVGKVLQSTESYQICMTRDYISHIEYLEMWGRIGEDAVFVMRSPVESIRENADRANLFLSYMGLMAVLLGGGLVWVFSRRIAAPIMELAGLSQRMANLDFNARYTSGGHNEIGILGQNFNIMSEKLERTISELQYANVRLQQDIEKKEKMETMRMEFLGNVSHELKTPIALIQGYAEGLKEGIDEDAESREFYCDVIMDEANKMNQIVKNLLILNQLEFGEDDVEMEQFDLMAVIKGVLSSCEILVQQVEANVTIHAEDVVYVWADEFKTEQVIRNYFTNAIHYVDARKQIEIEVTEAADTVRVTIFNSGNPIPKEDIGQLWDKFYKVDKARTRAYGGSGIGLSIVKAIMESFHQSYGVYNREDGVAFWFELQAVQQTGIATREQIEQLGHSDAFESFEHRNEW
jgi:signal transduction histidine kinase